MMTAGLDGWLRNLLVAIALAAAPGVASAQHIADGGEIRIGATTPALIRDTLGGFEIVEYRFVAMAGDRLKIDFSSSSPGGAFNLFSPADNRVLYESDGSGRLFETILGATGEYRVRVYLNQAAARRGEHTAYALAMAMENGTMNRGANPAPSSANGDDLVVYAPEIDGRAGAPADPTQRTRPVDDRYSWHIRSPDGPLPIMGGAGPQFRIIGQIEDGSPVQNLGCSEANGGYWCRVATLTRPRVSGWVNGRYVSDQGAGGPGYGRGGYVPGMPYDAVGPINCQFGGEAQMTSCNYGVVRNGPFAQVDITMPDGSNRSLQYRAGRFSGADDGMNVDSRRENGQAVVTVDGQETFYIPDDVVMGE